MILIHIHNGGVNDVYSSEPIEVRIIDSDWESDDPVITSDAEVQLVSEQRLKEIEERITKNYKQ